MLVLLNKSFPSPWCVHLGLLPDTPICPCWKQLCTMAGLAVLGLSLAPLLGLGTGTSLCLSRQFRMQGDYMLGGLFPLGSAEEAGLRHRTRPSSIVCTRYEGGKLGQRWGHAQVCGASSRG